MSDEKEIGLRERVSLQKLMNACDSYLGKTVGVGGWVRTLRMGGSGAYAFVKVYDGTTGHELQLVIDKEVPGFHELTKENGIGCAIFAVGEIIESQGRLEKIEMKPQSVRIVGKCDPATYPLGGKGLSLEYLRKVQHFRPRTTVLGAVQRIRNKLSYATHLFFQGEGYQYIHTPLITASDCEGGGEMFQVTTLIKDDDFEHKLPNGKADYSKDFFKRPAYLTVSGQLNAEIYATAMSSVYTFGPTFRAENSFTTRHLSEFWMIEPEIAFADLTENIDIAEGFLKFAFRHCLDNADEDLKILEDFEKKFLQERKKELQKEQKAQRAKEAEVMKKLKAEGKPIPKQAKKKKAKKNDAWRQVPLRDRLRAICDAEFARVDYTDAIKLLLEAVEKGHQFEDMKIEWGMDMGSEHERYLCETLFQRPTVVINYPKEIKAFYMRMNEDSKTVAAMDILVPGVGELVGGSQREERYEVLLARMRELGLDEKDYDWYLDLRRFGSVPHSGFGAGFERLVCYTTGIDNIRDAIPFPRYPGHADF